MYPLGLRGGAILVEACLLRELSHLVRCPPGLLEHPLMVLDYRLAGDTPVFADQAARQLRSASDETRTLAQLRSDVLRDLILDGAGLLPPADGETELREQTARPRGIVPTVNVVVPVLSLIGAEQTPA